MEEPAAPVKPRVLVTGGRFYRNKRAVWDALDRMDPGLVIQGGATGVDEAARAWCDENGVPCMTFLPAWKRYGKKAGPVRNRWMLLFGQPEIVMVFPGGRGTSNMLEMARSHGEVEVLDYQKAPA